MNEESQADFRVSVRRAALETLLDFEENSRFIDEALARRNDDFPPRDRRLLQEIVYGTVRRQNTIDALLSKYLKLPVPKQRPKMRWALRSSAYQIVYLLRIPAHAAVNQTLEAVKADAPKSKDVGFLNAVLQRLSKDVVRKTEDQPLESDDPSVIPIRDGFCHFARPVLPLVRLDAAKHLALKHSFPLWLVKRWLARFAMEECRDLLESLNRTPQTTARVTSRAPSRDEVIAKLEADGIQSEAGSRDDALLIARGSDLGASAALKDGWIQVQDLTAMEIGSMLAPPKGGKVLDLCSAPGGKASQLLDAVSETGEVVAADRSEDKLAIVRQNLSKLGENFRLVEVSGEPASVELGETFRHILVDAPCSNTGVLSRRADARWRLREKDLGSLKELQSQLLEAAYRHLEPGGRILYSTCSIEPEENEERVAALVANHPELEEVEVRQFLPHRKEGDGGFASLLLKPRS
ncbi:MAG: transcription antitermination factor NusB [Planctomycetota bacterium]